MFNHKRRKHMKKTLTLLSLFLILSVFSLDVLAGPRPKVGKNGKSGIKSATRDRNAVEGEESERTR